jgi:hypothetical protein
VKATQCPAHAQLIKSVLPNFYPHMASHTRPSKREGLGMRLCSQFVVYNVNWGLSGLFPSVAEVVKQTT